MKLIVVSGSYRKGKVIETLMEKAIEGALETCPDIEVNKIRLIEKNIKYCTNCMACKEVPPEEELSRCVIEDDMTQVYKDVNEADLLIIASPINIGDVTAVTKTFFERIMFVMSKVGKRYGIDCPMPRNPKKRKAVYILSTGSVPPVMQIFCDSASGLIKTMCECCFNAQIAGSLYAGAVQTRGAEFYFKHAKQLGIKLTS